MKKFKIMTQKKNNLRKRKKEKNTRKVSVNIQSMPQVRRYLKMFFSLRISKLNKEISQ